MIEDIQKAADLRDWYALAGLALALLIQAVRKYPLLGAKLWAWLPDGSKFLVPLFGGAVVAFVSAFLEGKPLVDALTAALGGAVTIGFGAMGVAAGLKESPLPWSGGAGGKPKDDDDNTPPDGKAVHVRFPMIVVALVGCSAAPLNPPCDEATLTGIVAECTLRVEQECASKGVPEADCQPLKDCDKRLDERAEACR